MRALEWRELPRGVGWEGSELCFGHCLDTLTLHPDEDITSTVEFKNYFFDRFLLSTFFAILFLVFFCRY